MVILTTCKEGFTVNIFNRFVITIFERYIAKKRQVDETRMLAEQCILLADEGFVRFYEDGKYIRMKLTTRMIADPPPIQVDTYLWKKHLSDEQLHKIR